MNSTESIFDVFHISWATGLIVLIGFILTLFIGRSKTRLNLAPGPKGFPIFGHLPLLTKDTHLTLNEYRKTYGPVFSIKFGRKYGVVLGDFETIKDIFNMPGLSTRIPKLLNLSSEFNNLAEHSGKKWQDRHRFVVSVLGGAKRAKTTEDIMQVEVTRLLETLEKQDLSQDVRLDLILSIVTNNVGVFIVCGKSFEADDPVMKLILKYNEDVMGYFHWMSFAESLGISKFVYKHLFPKVKAGLKAINSVDEFIRNEIAEHEKTLNPGNPRDFIDSCLIHMQKSDGRNKIHDYSSIRGDCQVLLLGGTESVRIAMEWCLLRLAKYPNIQEKAHQEIVDVLGDRRPTWADHSKLPYVQAVIMESQRFHTLVPLNAMRCAPRDMNIKGYDVPKGTWIFTNFWAVDHDPNLWTDPETFNPERFLNKERDKIIVPEFFIPFSIGNRTCPGEKTATIEIFIAVSSIIQQYLILPSINGVSFDGDYNFNCKPIHPEVRFQNRNKGAFKNIGSHFA